MPSIAPHTPRTALITGASSGLGLEIARLLLGNGDNVINASRTPSDLACENIATDLTNSGSIARMVELVGKKHPGCNLLVSCAGAMHWAEAGKNSGDLIDNDLAVNLSGMMKAVEGLMPLIRKNRGDIVIIGSTSSFNTPSGSSVYCAAKHGVLGYIKALQVECRNDDIRILGIHPGGFKSQFHIKAKTKIDFDSLIDPENLARLILDLLALPRNMEVSEIIINRKTASRE